MSLPWASVKSQFFLLLYLLAVVLFIGRVLLLRCFVLTVLFCSRYLKQFGVLFSGEIICYCTTPSCWMTLIRNSCYCPLQQFTTYELLLFRSLLGHLPAIISIFASLLTILKVFSSLFSLTQIIVFPLVVFRTSSFLISLL